MTNRLLLTGKYFLFAKTTRSSLDSANIFSLSDIAKENGFATHKYLLRILQTAPAIDLEQKLLPWNIQTNK